MDQQHDWIHDDNVNTAELLTSKILNNIKSSPDEKNPYISITRLNNVVLGSNPQQSTKILIFSFNEFVQAIIDRFREKYWDEFLQLIRTYCYDGISDFKVLKIFGNQIALLILREIINKKADSSVKNDMKALFDAEFIASLYNPPVTLDKAASLCSLKQNQKKINARSYMKLNKADQTYTPIQISSFKSDFLKTEMKELIIMILECIIIFQKVNSVSMKVNAKYFIDDKSKHNVNFSKLFESDNLYQEDEKSLLKIKEFLSNNEFKKNFKEYIFAIFYNKQQQLMQIPHQPKNVTITQDLQMSSPSNTRVNNAVSLTAYDAYEFSNDNDINSTQTISAVGSVSANSTTITSIIGRSPQNIVSSLVEQKFYSYEENIKSTDSRTRVVVRSSYFNSKMEHIYLVKTKSELTTFLRELFNQLIFIYIPCFTIDQFKNFYRDNIFKTDILINVRGLYSYSQYEELLSSAMANTSCHSQGFQQKQNDNITASNNISFEPKITIKLKSPKTVAQIEAQSIKDKETLNNHHQNTANTDFNSETGFASSKSLDGFGCDNYPYNNDNYDSSSTQLTTPVTSVSESHNVSVGKLLINNDNHSSRCNNKSNNKLVYLVKEQQQRQQNYKPKILPGKGQLFKNNSSNSIVTNVNNITATSNINLLSSPVSFPDRAVHNEMHSDNSNTNDNNISIQPICDTINSSHTNSMIYSSTLNTINSTSQYGESNINNNVISHQINCFQAPEQDRVQLSHKFYSFTNNNAIIPASSTINTNFDDNTILYEPQSQYYHTYSKQQAQQLLFTNANTNSSIAFQEPGVAVKINQQQQQYLKPIIDENTATNANPVFISNSSTNYSCNISESVCPTILTGAQTGIMVATNSNTNVGTTASIDSTGNINSNLSNNHDNKQYLVVTGKQNSRVIQGQAISDTINGGDNYTINNYKTIFNSNYTQLNETGTQKTTYGAIQCVGYEYINSQPTSLNIHQQQIGGSSIQFTGHRAENDQYPLPSRSAAVINNSAAALYNMNHKEYKQSINNYGYYNQADHQYYQVQSDTQNITKIAVYKDTNNHSESINNFKHSTIGAQNMQRFIEIPQQQQQQQQQLRTNQVQFSQNNAFH